MVGLDLDGLFQQDNSMILCPFLHRVGNQSQSSLGNPGAWFSVKKKRLLFIPFLNTFRCKRLKVIQDQRPQVRRTVQLDFPWASPLSCAVAMLEGDTGRAQLSEHSAQT